MTPVLVEQAGPVRWLRLNRPHRRNALDPGLVTALDAAMAEAMDDAGTAVVVIAGQGPSFCAGADLHCLRSLAEAGADPVPFLAGIAACFDRIEQAPKPVIAAVHGHVVAGGLELALACDIVIAQAGTLIGDGHLRHHLLPAAASSVRLPRKVGEPLARWLLLTGELLPANAFTGSGFIHHIAPADQFRGAVSTLADRLARRAGPTQTAAKYLLAGHLRHTQDGAADREHDAFTRNWRDADVVAALTRFTHPARQKGSRCGDTPIES